MSVQFYKGFDSIYGPLLLIINNKELTLLLIEDGNLASYNQEYQTFTEARQIFETIEQDVVNDVLLSFKNDKVH